MTCKPPEIPAFDVDIYDCPCGHSYGDHEYKSIGVETTIIRCTMCHPGRVRCNECGNEVNFQRRHYAIPTCYDCLPPPEPLPIREIEP